MLEEFTKKVWALYFVLEVMVCCIEKKERAMIRKATEKDIPAICSIYNYYVENTTITFEEQKVSHEEMSKRFQTIIKSLPYLVYEDDNQVIGYAYATPWKSRSAYRFSVESTVYLQNGLKGKGIGTKLYKVLLEELSKLDVHSTLGGIALPNAASIGLHEKLGFKKVAQLEEVGYKHDQWIDVGYWQYKF